MEQDQAAEEKWQPRLDLLGSFARDPHFVVEVEADGQATLRFGDGLYGRRPSATTIFEATYRVGNGCAGNVGAGAIGHIVRSEDGVTAVTNPLPARGGVDPESIADVRKNAPHAFRIQERAVTPADYAEVTERHPEVQKAAATLRWTGSWHTMFITVDRFGGRAVDTEFEAELRRHIERYRLAGHDVEVDAPRYVPLEIELFVCAKPGYFRSDVKEALLGVFSNYTLPDGRRGVFHPDNFSFGQPVYVSRLIAAATVVEGVASVEVTKFQRWQDSMSDGRKDGFLAMGRLEIARLENDPNFPEHGLLNIQMGGGK
jgi:predicted phage baseplate assembly protein